MLPARQTRQIRAFWPFFFHHGLKLPNGTMDKRVTQLDASFEARPLPRGRREVSLGTLHSFVEVSELRNLLGRLTAIEMLRILLADVGTRSAAEP